jgi:predicted small lipoprotein YifL
LLGLLLLAGCGQNSPTEAGPSDVAPPEVQFYKIKPDGTGVDKNGDGLTCTKTDDSVKGPFLVDNTEPDGDDEDTLNDCPAGYSPYGG